MNETSIAISGISKTYNLPDGTTITPLNNISFSIKRGEVLGIVGKNGSGKSTLLKILGEVTKPSQGHIDIYGQLTAILGTGSNFHLELSGHENVKMHLRIKGFDSKQSKEIMAQVHDFSGIGDFFFQPVKIYSDGMFLRLAFALAFHTFTDILLLDEVLAVGDESFRMKSYSHIKELKKKGATIVLVSHSRQEMLDLCDRCIWLESGSIKRDGHPSDIMAEYFESQQTIFRANAEALKKNPYLSPGGGISYHCPPHEPLGNESIAIKEFKIYADGDSGLLSSKPIHIELAIEKKVAEMALNFGIIFHDHYRQPACFITCLNHSGEGNYLFGHKGQEGLFRLASTLPGNLLAPGVYYLTLRFGREAYIGDTHAEEVFDLPDVFEIHVQNPEGRFNFIIKETDIAFAPFLDWSFEKLD